MIGSERASKIQQAKQLLNTGRLRDAESVCLQMLTANPADHQAVNLLSAIALQQGAMPEAEKFAAQALDLQPQEPMYLYNLGKIRALTGRHAEGLELYDRVLKLVPTQQLVLAGKAESLNHLGRIDEAIALLEPAVKKLHDSPDMGMNYAMLMAQRGRNQEAVAVATRHLANPAISDMLRTKLGQTLGRAHEDLGLYDQAFEAYRQSNLARAKTARYDPAQVEASLDRLMQVFRPERLKQLSQSTNQSELPVFIAGMPRSGTTLIEQIIASHPQGFGAGETTELERIQVSMQQELGSARLMPECLAEAPVATLDRMAQRYLDAVQVGAQPGATRIVDKYLRNHHMLGLVWMLFSKARIIHCRRNPVDTCLSCYISGLSPLKHTWCSDLVSLGHYYRQYERLMAYWKATLPLPMLEVNYEELVADQDAQTRRIIGFLGLPWDDKCLKFHENKRAVRTLSYDQVRRPIYTKAVDRHKHYEKFLGPLRESLAGRGPVSAG